MLNITGQMRNKNYNELVELKVDVLLRGIDFSDSEIQKYLRTGKITEQELLDQASPEEVILFNNEDQIRVESGSNKDSIYKVIKSGKDVLLLNQDYPQKKYKMEIIPHPEFYNEISPLGYKLRDYVTVTGKNGLQINPKLNCDLDDINRCKYCGSNLTPVPLDDSQLISEYLWAFKTACRYFTPTNLSISTGTHLNETDNEFFFRLFDKINKITGSQNLLKNSVFSLAPSLDFTEIDRFYKYGIGMLSFNMEFWNPDLFKKYCPGKASLFGRKQYLKVIKYCISNYGPGSVKTNFVLGLESIESIKNGISYLSELGCYCTGSIFYPRTEAALGSSYQNLNISYYIEVFRHISEMTRKYQLKIPWCKESGTTSLELEIINYSMTA